MDGKLQVIEFWDKYGDDPEMVDSAFQGKFDPLNRRQLEIFRKSKKKINNRSLCMLVNDKKLN